MLFYKEKKHFLIIKKHIEGRDLMNISKSVYILRTIYRLLKKISIKSQYKMHIQCNRRILFQLSHKTKLLYESNDIETFL